MHTIELTGSYTAALVGDETLEITTTRKDPVPALCRELVKRGMDPNALVQITRAGMAVWKNDRTIAAWADIDITDGDRDGLRVEKHRPFPGIVRTPPEHPAV